MLFKVERVAPNVDFFYIRSGPWCGGSQRRRYNFVCLVPPTRTLLFIGFIVVLYALLVVCGRDVTYTARPDLLPAWLLPSEDTESSGYLRSIITAVYLTAAGNIISTIGFVLGALLAIETVCADPGLLLPDIPPDGDLACTARHNAALNVNGIYAEHFDHDGAYRQACEAYRTSFCKTCLHYRPLKSAHCPLCGVCVLDMDHHCTVLGRCIGGRNLRYFLALMVVAAATGWRIGVQFFAFVMCRLSTTMLGASTHGLSHHQSCAHDHQTPITPARDALAIFGMVASFAVAGGVSFLLSNYARSLCVPGAEAPRVGFWRRWCSKQQAPSAAAGDAAGDAASPNTVASGEAMSVAERIKATPIDPATGNPILSVPSWHPAYEAELKRWQAEREQAAAEESAAELEKGQPADWRAALRRYRERWLTLPWVHALAPRTPTMISIWLRERPVREWAAARRRGGVSYPNMQRKPLGVDGGDSGEGADTAIEVAPLMVEGEEEMEEFVA